MRRETGAPGAAADGRASNGLSPGWRGSDCCFFFQAEDGIRDLTVTGVQTCALPICETGEAITEAIAAMQGKQNLAFSALERAVRLDRRELSEHFTAARKARTAAARSRLLIGLACLVFALVGTAWLSRSALGALRELSSGFARFGKGDFSQPVVVTTRDEFGAVAEAANRMADSLRQLGQERDHNEWLTRGQARLADELRGELT